MTLDDRKAKLEKLRAERADLEAKRSEKMADVELDEELEKEERALRELAKIEELEDEHGPIGRKWDKVDTGEGMICLKRPHPNTYRKFVENGEKLKSQDCEQFVRPCLLYPDKAEFNRILEVEPAALIRCAGKCSDLAGMRKAELSGK